MTHEPYIRYVPGSPCAVLMIHGIVGTPSHFAPLMPVIPEDWSVYNILLDGHGQGVEEFGRTSMERWKQQVQNTLSIIMEHHEKVVLVAHSMGTLFSIQAAVDRPENIAALFLLNVPTRPLVKFTTAITSVRLMLGDDSNPKAQAMSDASSVTLDWRIWKYIPWIPRFLELLVECNRTRRLLPQLGIPCQAFQSRHDELVAYSSCKDFAAAQAVTLTVLPESGHFSYSEADTALLCRALGQCLEAAAKTTE